MANFCPNCFCAQCNEVREKKEAEFEKNNPPPCPPEGFRLLVVHYFDHNSGARRSAYHAVKADTAVEIRTERADNDLELVKSIPPGTHSAEHSRSEWDGATKLPEGSLRWSTGRRTQGCGAWEPHQDI